MISSQHHPVLLQASNVTEWLACTNAAAAGGNGTWGGLHASTGAAAAAGKLVTRSAAGVASN